MKAMRKKIMLLIALIVGCAAGGVWLFTHSARFGALPQGEHLERLTRSPRYVDGEFRNELPTPILTEEKNMIATYAEFLFSRPEGLTPPAPVPAVRADLKALDPNEDVLVWLGHSSFYLQLQGRRILIDPVLSAYASPVPFSTRAFSGSTPYAPDDLPDIDVLLISHDHWDHLDYATLTALRPRIGAVVCGLGVGAHLRRWGFAEERIREGDWGDAVAFGALTVHVTPARHYSGRTLTRNKNLWAGFVLESPQRRLFFSGDSGYGPHFAELGRRFGSFDLVMLDCGQYDRRWGLIHMMPEETAQAAQDLHAATLLPAHAGKFSIAYHPWDDPYRRIEAASRDKGYRLLMPRIGEPLSLDDPIPRPGVWWKTGGKSAGHATP